MATQTFKTRVKTPTVLQMEATECGAASLSMILQYYKCYIPLTQLRELCGVSRDGSDAANLVLAAQKIGLEARGFKKGLNALRTLKPPAIIFWEFNHFVVFEGFSGKGVFINDPASGRRLINEEDFDYSYTGVAITLQPSPNFKATGSAPTIWGSLYRRIKLEPRAIGFVLICGFLLILPQLIFPVFSQLYMDEIIGNEMRQWLKPMLWAMALTIGLQVALQQLQLVVTRKLERQLTRTFSFEYEKHMLSLPERFYSQRHAIDIANRMSINSSVSEFVSSSLISSISGSALLFFYLILTFSYSPYLGILIIATTGINAFIVAYTLQIQKEDNVRLQKNIAKGSNILVSAIRDIETVKAAALERDIYKRYIGYQSKYMNLSQKIEIRNAKLNIIPSALTTFNEIAILLIGFLLVIQGELTLGMLLAAQAIAFNLKGEIESIIGFIQSLPQFEASLLRLEDVIEQPIDPILIHSDFANGFSSDVSSSNSSLRLTGAIKIKDLNFSYSGIDKAFIEDFDLNIISGQQIAIVGGSGSGKSTMGKLIAGLYQPTSGAITFDGQALIDIDRSVATRSIAMVQQEILLYGCTVRENLTLWNKPVSNRLLLQACDDAEIHEVIKNLSNGMETILQENGSNLSGGQRQRLEIARALAQQPSILIMDEATSALDSETEKNVIHNISLRGCTQIVIAHRLSTIRDADLIVVMNKGKIVQKGTHEELIAQVNSPYSQLLESEQ